MSNVKLNFIENNKYVISNEISNYKEDIIYLGKHIKKNLGLRKNPFTFKNKYLKVNGIAGTLLFKDIKINILPKNFNIKGNLKCEEYMLKKLYFNIVETNKNSLDKIIYISKYNTQDLSEYNFLEFLAEQFIKDLNYSIRKGILSINENIIEKRSFIRGKILIQKQLQNNIMDPKIWCKYSGKSKKNDINNLLIWTCKYFLKVVKKVQIKKQLLKFINEFNDVKFDKLNLIKVKKIKCPIKYRNYYNCIEIAKSLYINNYNEIKFFHHEKIGGYAINMEKAFENILEYYLKIASRKLNLYHESQSKMNLAKCDNVVEYFVKPDNIVKLDESVLIIDAKYKIQNKENRKPKREDFYQMIATCIAYNTYKAILIYPQIIGETKYENSWKLNNVINNNYIEISSRQLDILANSETIENSLIEILNEYLM